MWIFTTNREMVNVSHAEKIELRHENNLVIGNDRETSQGDNITGMSIVAHFPDKTESQLAFIALTPNHDQLVARYWNAIRTAIKARAEICDLMDII